MTLWEISNDELVYDSRLGQHMPPGFLGYGARIDITMIMWRGDVTSWGSGVMFSEEVRREVGGVGKLDTVRYRAYTVVYERPGQVRDAGLYQRIIAVTEFPDGCTVISLEGPAGAVLLAADEVSCLSRTDFAAHADFRPRHEQREFVSREEHRMEFSGSRWRLYSRAEQQPHVIERMLDRAGQ